MTSNLFDSYFNQKNIFIKHQLESYNYYIDELLPSIISNTFPVEVNLMDSAINKVSLDIININTVLPKISENNGCTKLMTPFDARNRNHTYSMTILVDIEVVITINDGGVLVDLKPYSVKDVLFGKIPIMVGSKYCVNNKLPDDMECKYDGGGYMIVNGNEKVIITQERVIPNKIQIFKHHKLLGSKYSLICEVRSQLEESYMIPKIVTLKMKTSSIYDAELYVNISNIKIDIPLKVLFKLLGCETDKEIVYYVIDNNCSELDEHLKKMLRPTLIQCNNIYTKRDAIDYMCNTLSFKVEQVNDLVDNIYLCHLGNNLIKKRYFTGNMVNKLFKTALGVVKHDDRDSYLSKRVESPGVLMGNISYLAILKIVADIKNNLKKEINSNIYEFNLESTEKIVNSVNIYKILKSSYLENSLKSALATGNWGLKSNINKQGVSQILNRLTHLSTLSHYRRISTPSDPTGKITGPRKINSSIWGYVCPSETPEGQQVGLVKNLANSCEITISSNPDIIKELFTDYIIDLQDINIYNINKTDNILVYINGDILGYTFEPAKLIEDFKKYRSELKIDYHASIFWNIEEYYISIYCDSGRLIRPLIKIKDDKSLYDLYDKDKKYKWEEYISNVFEKTPACIEYIDVYELNNILLSNNLNNIKGKRIVKFILL